MLLALEPLIVARLRTLPGLLGVYGAAEFADLAKAGKPSPCAYVLYGGYSVIESDTDGTAARVQEQYLVVLSLKHAGPSAGGAQVRAEAPAEIAAVVGALMGWQPDARSYKALRLAAAPRPEPMSGRLLFPLAFAVEHVVTAVP